MIKQCSKCKAPFECSVLRSSSEKDCKEEPGCWCDELYINLETLAMLKKEFDNCLCKSCLEAYATAERE
ncbi:MAG TPA: cysteine-rich CWC family protein [Bacteroidia bacterium]